MLKLQILIYKTLWEAESCAGKGEKNGCNKQRVCRSGT